MMDKQTDNNNVVDNTITTSVNNISLNEDTTTTTTATTANATTTTTSTSTNNKETEYHQEYDVDFRIKENRTNASRIQKRVMRDITCQDAVQWLKDNTVASGTSVITSLPDIVEMTGYSLQQYRDWFVDTVELITSKLSDNNVAIFYQTDIRRKVKGNKGIVDEYLDKGYLCAKGAERSGCKMVWHKLMYSVAPELGKVSRGQTPGFSHMLCFAKKPGLLTYQEQTPDIAPRGGMVWKKAMGLNACMVALRYIRGVGCNTVLDTFCGKGSVLAAANMLGLHAIGVDLSISKTRHSSNLVLTMEMVESFSASNWNNMDNKDNKDNNNSNNNNNDEDVDEDEQT
ncbi:hypothetical protein SAMD00019534_083600, partial [Acytostelium subglobosum LB1]|uniref:hypothetical protein n=1 Tax=Acytostelium subglobosum LB1 TaxID=1410327 RepID=UPI000644A3E4